MTHLKFRLFPKNTSKYLGKMREVGEINFNGRVVSNDSVIFRLEDVHIMQSTGLTDKNGKEIFEGDVVEYLDASGLANEDVGINHGIVELDLREGIHFTNRSSVEMEDVDFDSDVEIIGNIYENPELINS